MYAYDVQQEDIDILRQSNRITFVRVELLNSSLQIVNTIEGQIYNDSFSLDGESAVRRTYNCDIIVNDEMFLVGYDKNIWADRFIRVNYGIKHIKSDRILWYRLGTFSFVDISYTYSTTQKMLSLTCSDMMAFYNGTKGGVVVYNTEAKAQFKVEAGQKYIEVLSGLCEDAGIVNYSIQDVDDYEIPYDIEFSVGSTYYDVWNKLKDLYGYWQFFFDEDGNFVWKRIPDGIEEPILLDDAVLKPLIISENYNDSFQNIYNVTEIWGKELDLADDDRFVDSADIPSVAPDGQGVINITLYDGVGDNKKLVGWLEDNEGKLINLDNLTYIAIRVNTTNARYININGLQNIPIITADGSDYEAKDYLINTVYVFCYRRTVPGNIFNTNEADPTYPNFYLLGQYQAHGYYEETDDNLPYSINNLGYRSVRVIEMSDLFCDEYCQNQAVYETYNTTAKQDTITLSAIIIPFIEPSTKVRFSPFITNEMTEWIIKKISWSTMSGIMNVEMYRFNMDYSYVQQKLFILDKSRLNVHALS